MRSLFCHAGILWGWLVFNKAILGILAPEVICSRLNGMWTDENARDDLLKVLGDIPISRWGPALFGSPVWNDLDDMEDKYEELPGYYQVFGHSQQEINPIIGNHFACLDCRRAFRLTAKGEIKEYYND